MNKYLCLLALFVLGFALIKADKGVADAQGPGASDLYIDDQGQVFDENEGSAGSDDEDYSGVNPTRYPGDDEDNVEGSTWEPAKAWSNCQREVIKIKSQNPKSDAIPQCTENGEYKAIQCRGSNGDCWCVNFKGVPIPGTISREPWITRCEELDRSRNYPQQPNPEPEINKPVKDKNLGAGPPTDTDMIIEPSTDADQSTKTNTGKGSVDINNMEDSEEDKTDESNEDHRSDGKKEQLREGGLLRQPLILAGLIAIAVVCLLCAVLLVMFIVYRMRKKDEGSYALDEPKRSPSHPYQRAPTREFFA